MISEKSLKRMVRAMNSILNLYDVEDIPETLVDILMKGVVQAAGILNLDEYGVYDDDGVLQKYIVPENLEEWLSTGEETNAEQETEETSSPF